jgi:hypothetical protein
MFFYGDRCRSVFNPNFQNSEKNQRNTRRTRRSDGGMHDETLRGARSVSVSLRRAVPGLQIPRFSSRFSVEMPVPMGRRTAPQRAPWKCVRRMGFFASSKGLSMGTGGVRGGEVDVVGKADVQDLSRNGRSRPTTGS